MSSPPDFSYGTPGELLFHYTTAAIAFENILPDGKLRLSPYSSMRDPLEAQHWPEPVTYWVDDSNPDQEALELGRMSVVVAAKSTAKLLSLTVDADYGEDTDPFGRGYARASLWQMYADDHRGVCLAFDREALLDALSAGLASTARLMAEPVRYVQSLAPDALPSEPLRDTSQEAFDLAVDDYLDKNADRLLFSKLLDWSGEHEFRFVALRHENETEPIDVPYGGSLRAVICGHQLPGWQRAGGAVICRENGNPDLLRCIWMGRRPMIVRDVPGHGEHA